MTLPFAGSNPASATTIHIPPKNKKLKLAMCTPFKNHKSIYSPPMNSRLYFVESSLKLLLLQIGLYARFYKKRILQDIPRLFFFAIKTMHIMEVIFMKRAYYVFLRHLGESCDVWIEDHNGYLVWFGDNGKPFVNRYFKRGEMQNTKVFGPFYQKAELETGLGFIIAQVKKWGRENRGVIFKENLHKKEA